MSDKEWESELEFHCNENPVCPHCRESLSPDGFENSGDHETDCPECGKPILITTNYERTFDTYAPRKTPPTEGGTR